MESFKYLINIINCNGRIDQEVKNQRHNRTVEKKEITPRTKIQIHNVVIKPIVIYDEESLPLSKDTEVN